MGLYTPTILGGNAYLNWFYDRGAIKDPAHTGTSKGLSQAINRGPIRKFLPKYANVYVTIQSHGLIAGVRTHYVTTNGVRNGLCFSMAPIRPILSSPRGRRKNSHQLLAFMALISVPSNLKPGLPLPIFTYSAHCDAFPV